MTIFGYLFGQEIIGKGGLPYGFTSQNLCDSEFLRIVFLHPPLQHRTRSPRTGPGSSPRVVRAESLPARTGLICQNLGHPRGGGHKHLITSSGQRAGGGTVMGHNGLRALLSTLRDYSDRINVALVQARIVVGGRKGGGCRRVLETRSTSHPVFADRVRSYTDQLRRIRRA